MQVHATKGNSLQTFSGAHADHRFSRDDMDGDVVLRERDLHSNVPAPMRLMYDDEPLESLPPDDGDADREDGRDDLFPRPKALNFGY